MQTPNFVFTDPVAAQQYVQLAQLAQAEQAARDQSMLGTLQALNQRGISRDTRASEDARYRTQADLTRAQMASTQSEAEKNRAAKSADLTATLEADKEIAKANRDAEATRYSAVNGKAAEAEKYNFLKSLVESDDPPTDVEFEQFSAGINPERKAGLDMVRKRTIDSLVSNADTAEKMAAQWNDRLVAVSNPANQTGHKPADIVDAAMKSQSGRYIVFDPGANKFLSRIPRPRASLKQSSKAVIRTIDDVMNRVRELGGRVPLPAPARESKIAVPPAVIGENAPGALSPNPPIKIYPGFIPQGY